MQKSISFVRLDIMTVKPYLKSLLLLLLMSVFMVFTFKTSTILPFYLIMCLSLIVSYPFSIGEKNSMDILYSTLSLRRETIVTGRYLFAVCMEIICFVLVISMSILFSSMIDLEFVFAETIFYLSIASLIFSFVVSIQYPVFFRYGYNKAKFVGYAPIALISFGIALLPSLISKLNIDIDKFSGFIDSHSVLTSAVCFSLGIFMILLSRFISGRLYAKRDI